MKKVMPVLMSEEMEENLQFALEVKVLWFQVESVRKVVVVVDHLDMLGVKVVVML